MCTDAGNYATLPGQQRRPDDNLAPDLKAHVPTAAIVAAGLAVWAMCLLLML
jgi:hypothetical protein